MTSPRSFSFSARSTAAAAPREDDDDDGARPEPDPADTAAALAAAEAAVELLSVEDDDDSLIATETTTARGLTLRRGIGALVSLHCVVLRDLLAGGRSGFSWFLSPSLGFSLSLPLSRLASPSLSTFALSDL